MYSYYCQNIFLKMASTAIWFYCFSFLFLRRGALDSFLILSGLILFFSLRPHLTLYQTLDCLDFLCWWLCYPQ